MKASLLNAALAYAAKGMPVFPLAPGTKVPMKGSHGHLDATTREAVVRANWELHPDANIGMPTGATSGYIVIDEDPRHGGTVAELQLPPTLTARTPGGGRHYYFTHPGSGYDVPCDTLGQRLGPGIDIKGDRGYAVLPPSRVDGKLYGWIDSSVPAAALPPNLWPRMVVKADPAKANGKHPPSAPPQDGTAEPIPERQRNGTLTSLGGSMRRRGMTQAEIETALLAVNAARCVPPLAAEEVAKIAHSVSRYAPARGESTANGHHQQRKDSKPDEGQHEGVGEDQEPWRPSAQSACDLMAKELAPVRWVVQDLIAEGLTLLAAKPKKGKSTLMLSIGCSIAQGTLALGHFETEQSEVLYLALEDNERRMQRRLRRMLSGEPPPKGLWLVYAWLPLDRGGMSPLEVWLDEHPAVRVVVIDTLEHIRPRRKVANGLYGDDYASVRWLQQLAGTRQMAIVAITHLRKAPADDPFDEINASNGLLSGVDNAIVLRPSQGLVDVHRRGREYEDDTPIALKGNQETLLWSWQGTAEDAHRSESRKKILECLREHGPLSPLEMTEFAEGLTRENVRQLLSRMLKEKTPPIVKDGEDYRLA